MNACPGLRLPQSALKLGFPEVWNDAAATPVCFKAYFPDQLSKSVILPCQPHRREEQGAGLAIGVAGSRRDFAPGSLTEIISSENREACDQIAKSCAGVCHRKDCCRLQP